MNNRDRQKMKAWSKGFSPELLSFHAKGFEESARLSQSRAAWCRRESKRRKKGND